MSKLSSHDSPLRGNFLGRFISNGASMRYWSRPERLARSAARMNGRNQICAAEAASLSSKTPWYPSANAPSALRRGWRDGLFYYLFVPFIFFAALLLPTFAEAALININTADATLLDTLPGVGSVIAGRIVAYRTTNGPFRTIEDIQKVSGIGSGSTYAKIAPFISVGTTSTEDSSSPSATTTQTTQDQATSVPSGTYKPPPMALSLHISGGETSLLEVPLQFSARVTTASGVVDSSARIVWSFGDGSSGEGDVVTKTYHYAGTYLVVASASDGFAHVQDDFTVVVAASSVRIATISNEGITIANDSSNRLDLSGWQLFSGNGTFRIPGGMVILPNATVLFPFTITNLPIAFDATLHYPDGLIAARFPSLPVASVPEPDASDSVASVQPSESTGRYNQGQRVEPITSQGTSVQSYAEAGKAPAATTELVAAGAVSTASPAGTAAVADAPASGLFHSPWFFGLLGIMTVAGGAFIFL